MGGGVWLGGGMDVVDTLGSLDLGDPSAILRYWESELLQALYFRPKGVSLNCPYASLGVRKASSAEVSVRASFSSKAATEPLHCWATEVRESSELVQQQPPLCRRGRLLSVPSRSMR